MLRLAVRTADVDRLVDRAERDVDLSSTADTASLRVLTGERDGERDATTFSGSKGGVASSAAEPQPIACGDLVDHGDLPAARDRPLEAPAQALICALSNALRHIKDACPR